MSENKSVLVVDDDPRYLRLVEVNLMAEEYDVRTAMNGQEAVETVAAKQPDLILLDVMMPIMDGFTACERIREFSNVPIIILTAKGEERDRVRGLDAGADDAGRHRGPGRTTVCNPPVNPVRRGRHAQFLRTEPIRAFG